MRHTRIERRPSLRSATFWTQWLLGSALMTGLLLVLAQQHTGEIDPHYRYWAALAVLGSLPVYSLLEVYHKHQSCLRGLVRLLGAWLMLLVGLVGVGFISQNNRYFSREVFLLWAGLGFVVQAVAYPPLHLLSRRHWRRQEAQCNTLIVGCDRVALDLVRKLKHQAQAPLLGLVSTRANAVPYDGRCEVIGTVKDLPALIRRHAIRRLYIAVPLSEANQVRALHIDLLDANVDVIWVPDLYSLTLLNHSISDMDGMPAIHLNESPLTTHPTAALTKTILDRCLAALGIVVLSPLLIATAIAVKCSSPGPVIFKQLRHGWNGKFIEVWKFRSMRVHDGTHVHQATRADPRITRVGRFIRRASIDELPQLFNVLRGDMSLVGPRPHAIAHNDYYTGKIVAYLARHRIKPGITGLAQIRGCRGETETLDKMQRRVEVDLEYINNWSLGLDLKILVKTPFSLFSKDVY